jgi:hypothetical protein
VCARVCVCVCVCACLRACVVVDAYLYIIHRHHCVCSTELSKGADPSAPSVPGAHSLRAPSKRSPHLSSPSPSPSPSLSLSLPPPPCPSPSHARKHAHWHARTLEIKVKRSGGRCLSSYGTDYIARTPSGLVDAIGMLYFSSHAACGIAEISEISDMTHTGLCWRAAARFERRSGRLRL